MGSVDEQTFLERARAGVKGKILTGWAIVLLSIAVPCIVVVNIKDVEQRLMHRINLAASGLESGTPSTPLELDLTKRLALSLEGAQGLAETARMLFRAAIVFLACAGLGAGLSSLASGYRDRWYLRIIDRLEAGGGSRVR
jgi:hypothetical protein